MANINENRKLMVEQMKNLKSQLSEGKKRLTVNDTTGQRIMQAINNNYPLIHIKMLKARGEFDKETIGETAEVMLPVLRNGIKAALNHKYTLHPDIDDVPSNTHKDYYRFKTKKEMQATLDKTIKGLKELLGLVEAAMKKTTIKSLTEIGNLCWELFNVDAGTAGYLGAHILDSGNRQSSFI